MTDTILIDGTDIQTSARIMKRWEGVHETAPLRGQLLTYPGVDGEVNLDQPFGPTIFGLGVMVLASTVTTVNDQLRTLKRLCKPGGVVTLTKTRSFTSGDEAVTARAKLRTFTPAQESPSAYLVALEFNILDGVWYAGSTSSASLSTGLNHPSIVGEVRTRNMTITLTGGTLPRLANDMTGSVLEFTGTMGSPVVIDVLNSTATQSSADVSEMLSFLQASPFALAPGTNDILLLGGGTASITYTPAY